MRLAHRSTGWSLLIAGTVGLAVALGDPEPSHSTHGAKVTADAKPQELVELAWLAEPATFPCQLAAYMVGGELVVGGVVPDDGTRQIAINIAEQHAKVPVKSKIIVQAGSAFETQPVGQDVLCQRAVEKLMKSFKKYDGSFQVEADGSGRVLVSGFVPSPKEKLKVSRVLSQLAGCNSVANNLTVSSDLGQSNANTIVEVKPSIPSPSNIIQASATSPAPAVAQSEPKQPRTPSVLPPVIHMPKPPAVVNRFKMTQPFNRPRTIHSEPMPSPVAVAPAVAPAPSPMIQQASAQQVVQQAPAQPQPLPATVTPAPVVSPAPITISPRPIVHAPMMPPATAPKPRQPGLSPYAISPHQSIQLQSGRPKPAAGKALSPYAAAPQQQLMPSKPRRKPVAGSSPYATGMKPRVTVNRKRKPASATKRTSPYQVAQAKYRSPYATMPVKANPKPVHVQRKSPPSMPVSYTPRTMTKPVNSRPRHTPAPITAVTPPKAAPKPVDLRQHTPMPMPAVKPPMAAPKPVQMKPVHIQVPKPTVARPHLPVPAPKPLSAKPTPKPVQPVQVSRPVVNPTPVAAVKPSAMRQPSQPLPTPPVVKKPWQGRWKPGQSTMTKVSPNQVTKPTAIRPPVRLQPPELHKPTTVQPAIPQPIHPSVARPQAKPPVVRPAAPPIDSKLKPVSHTRSPLFLPNLQRTIRTLGKGKASNIEVKQVDAKRILVSMVVTNVTEAEKLAGQVLELPELAPYQVDMEVKLAE